jgi:hypothetical protein
MGTSQPAVARLEHGDYRGYTLGTLARAAHAVGRRLKVELVPSAAYPRKTAVESSAVKYAKKPVSRMAAKRKK